ncbi:hypothetical protein BC332_14702 [Capsicum chinense]|nr:hypothetical protein BC332_14702 [Capsicum chinense]
MEKQGEIEKGKANNFEVSFSALRKDVVNVQDFMERLNNEEGQNAVDMADQIEELKFLLEEFKDEMSDSRQRVENLLRQILVGCQYNMDHVLPSPMDNIDDCISSCHHSTSSATMTDEQLNFLLLNLHHISMHLAEKIFPLETQYEILQKVSGNMKDFHGLIVNGCIEHKIVQYVLPQLQRMAERVGLFLWNDQTYGDSRLFKLAHLLMKIIPIELEVMQICYTNLKASPSVEVGRFIKQLLETSPEVLREYLIHLQEHMVTVITASTSGARNIHVMIEFLLIVLTEMPKDFIHHEKLFDLLARLGALIREVSTLVHDLEEKSRNEESTDETTLDLLEEKLELLKEDLKNDYLKARDSFQWCFPMSDGPLFMHLLLIHLNDLLDSNSYSIDVSYEAKAVIDSIVIRDNGLFHLIFSLPIAIKKINIIKEDVSQLPEKIPKNKSLIVVNSPKNPVERKSLTTGKIIVGFEEETNWLITMLTSGPKDLDVISITGMPGSGKTTLAYKVYNDKSVCSHFDLRAWCTVDQDYYKKDVLVKLFNQVTGSALKFSKDIDVADMLRRQLFGKRYLIVLDDVWDTTTWDDLTRPFPDVEKGSRIILTTRQKEVTFHGKVNTDPLNLRLLSPEECLEKAVWLEVRNNLNSTIFGSEVNVMKVIELSYGHLPHHMKPCFLYLASFPKDTAVHRVMLKMYWRAEGLVEQTGEKSLEEVMEIYLDNLISSSLVIAFSEIGDNLTCQLHDLVHDFCLIKSREEKLFGRISSSDPSSSSDLMASKVSINYDKGHFEPNNFVLFNSKKKRHSAKHLCSLLINGDKMEDRLSDACHLRYLRLFKVLILEPSFIKESRNPGGCKRRINLANTDSRGFKVREIERIRETHAFLFKRYRGYFPKISSELEFESSNANDCGPSLATNWSWDFHFPSNLKTLLLSDFPLTTDSLSTIARLSNLEELFLTRTIIQGEEWNMVDEDTFVNLKYLKLDEVTLAKWEVGEESFPVIEKLVLWKCHMLMEIPPSFGDICSLKIIKLVKSPQLEDSAKKIKQYVEDPENIEKKGRISYFGTIKERGKENEGDREKEETNNSLVISKSVR